MLKSFRSGWLGSTRDPLRSALGRLERAVMDTVWAGGDLSVRDVQSTLGRPVAYTTVMTTLTILVEKRGVLRRAKHGRAYLYEPTVSAETVGRSMVSDLTEHLFGGSVNSLVLSLVNCESMSAAAIGWCRD